MDLSVIVWKTGQKEEEGDKTTAAPPGSVENTAESSLEKSGNVCRPWDRKDMKTRVSSFVPTRWFGKPQVISPLECARHGWICKAQETLHCLCCGATLCFKMSPSLSTTSRENLARKYAEQLLTAHSKHCPWLGNPSDSEFSRLPLSLAPGCNNALADRTVESLATVALFKHALSCLSQNTLLVSSLVPRAEAGLSGAFVATFLEISRKLVNELASPNPRTKGLLASPSLPSSGPLCHKPQNHTFAVFFLLAVCGWTCDSVGAQDSGKTNLSTTKAELHCEYCCRKLVVPQPVALSTAGRPGGKSDNGTHPAKRQKIVNNKAARSSITSLIHSTASSSSGLMDPVSSHRYFCPYNHSICFENHDAYKESCNEAGWMACFKLAFDALSPMQQILLLRQLNNPEESSSEGLTCSDTSEDVSATLNVEQAGGNARNLSKTLSSVRHLLVS